MDRGGLAEEDALYLMGSAQPATSSVLVSSSKYLNNPLFRDVYAQMGLKRDGEDLPSAYLIPEINRAFAEVTDGERLTELIAEAKAAKPDFRGWLDARFTSAFQEEALRGFAPGTLGAEVADFLSASGFKIDFMFTGPAETDLDYLNKRRVQVHDIEHMVTGFDPSPVGEISLIVANIAANHAYFDVELAQQLNAFGVFLMSTSLMRAALHYPSLTPVYLEGVARGRALGQAQARPLFMIKWEDYLDWPMGDIRASLGFNDAPPKDHWAWTYAAARG